MQWAVKRGGAIKSLDLLLDGSGDDVSVAQHLAKHAASLQDLHEFDLWKGGDCSLDVETAGALNSALVLLLVAAKKLEHLYLRAPISIYLPAVSSIRHLTLAVWQQDDGVVIFGCMTQRACDCLAALANLETLTLKAELPEEDSIDENVLKERLNLRGLHLQSLLLDGITPDVVDLPSMRKLHVVSYGEDSVTAQPAMLASLATCVSYTDGCAALCRALQVCACLSYLELKLVKSGSECKRVSLIKAMRHVRVLKLSGRDVHVVLGDLPQLQVLWATAVRTLDLECLQPTALASSLQYVHLEFRFMQCVSLLLALRSMAAAGKDWSASSEVGRKQAWQQVIGRYPGACWRQMQKLFCHCSTCMHKDVDRRIEECSRPCGWTRITVPA